MNKYNFKKRDNSSVLIKNDNYTVVLSSSYVTEYKELTKNKILSIVNKFNGKILYNIDLNEDSVFIEDVESTSETAKDLDLELDSLGIFFLNSDSNIDPRSQTFLEHNLYAHKGLTILDTPFENDTNSPQLVDSWDLEVENAGTYNITVTVEYNVNTNSKDAIFRFDLNGQTGININQESKDPTNRVFFTTFAFDDLVAGNNLIEFYASIENPQGSNKVTIYSNRFTAQKVNGLS